MKTSFCLPLILAASVSVVSLRLLAQAQTPAEPVKEVKPETPSKVIAAQKPLPGDPEERFKFLFTKATLSGRWAPLNDGQIGEERAGDKYGIVGVVKGTGDNWTVNARMNYRGQEMVMPVPVKIKFVGDSTILEVNNLMVPGGGTYTARLLIYERTYSGTWKGQRGGGMLYGTITNESE